LIAATTILAFEPNRTLTQYADYGQWEQAQRQPPKSATAAAKDTRPAAQSAPKKKLSYLEAREYASIEQRITEAEQRLQSKRTALEDPAIASDGPKLVAAQGEMESAQNDLDKLFARWAELQEKAESLSRR